MRKLLVLLLFLCSTSVFAQDVIVKKDGSTVVCRVEKVSDTDVTYKLWTDLKGSSYVMDKSLVSAINYENGKKETFGETESLYKPNNQNDGVQAMNDAALLKMDFEANNNGSWTYKRIKRLKTWGWIGGGTLAAVGITMLALAGGGSSGFHHDHDMRALEIGGAVCLATGAGVTTTCLVIAHKQKKKLDAAALYSSLYRYDIPFSNGSTLSVGADMLHDRIMNNRTVGLGLSYNF